ncbi:acyl-CoA dehydrogenase family protein [Lysobacter capsici]|uniref:acyl-CoA dehydrogenase family protein n=1 Tax=Lysobacter capsici TaxID=435897 RepID=UPI000BBB532B|nr:acyl-CoA dehydrogenase family protein [Lysobacter capsici]ATE72605.1 DNA alkylation response protein [Lysobacter capsici]
MDTLPPFATHRVENQPPPFAPRDLWRDDHALREAVEREGGAGFAENLAAYGALAGGELYELSFDAHRDKPRLRNFDAYGHRIDRVEFHPNYHAIMGHAIGHGVAGLSWHDPRPGSHVVRAALSYLHHQVEPGTSCPLTMTHASVPVLRHAPALHEWMRKAAAPHYDGRDVGYGDKAGLTLGMGMTEKQGGSDVRSNQTVATPIGNDEYELVGHKWFFSAPMSDGFLVLAQAPGGLSCFLMPRWHPHGGKNALRLMRLKDKLGDWSNASSEVEFLGAWAQRIGEEGRGVATIIEMVMLTRLDCMLGSAGEMRMALAQALHHARHRRSFGKPLIEHALMRNVIADLAIESEAATALAIRVAGAIDRAPSSAHDAAFARIATAIGKFWICKRAPAFVNEAQECLGGAGYVEESILPRLYRQAPLNSIWEGSGNIQCLDVLRALGREPEAGRALLVELERARGRDDALDARIDELAPALTGTAQLHEAQMRAFVERLALALQAALLFVADSPAAVGFCRSRVGDAHGLGFGTLPHDLELDAIVVRSLPV